MEMTPEEYKQKRNQAMRFQASQREEDRRNTQIIKEMRQEREVQNKIFVVAVISAIGAALAAIFSLISIFK